jgi:hypothetical protein
MTSTIKYATNGANALPGLTAELNAFGETFHEGIALAAPPTMALVPSPLCKTRAIHHAQDLEEYLDDGKPAADAYKVIKHPGLCKAWIDDTLPAM